MTLSNLIHPVRLLRNIEPTQASNKSNNSEEHINHSMLKKQHSKEFGDGMQKVLSKNNPVFIEDELEKKKLKTKLNYNSQLSKMALNYKLNQS